MLFATIHMIGFEFVVLVRQATSSDPANAMTPEDRRSTIAAVQDLAAALRTATKR